MPAEWQTAWSAEAERQRSLLQALFAAEPAAQPLPALGAVERGASWTAGLAAYRGNGQEHARGALRAVFPTLRAMLGDSAFDALCARYWQAQPPQIGDLAHIGVGLPAFVHSLDDLRRWPWLGHSAQLDLACWAVLFDPPAALTEADLHRLAEADPATLQLRLAQATRLLASPWPIVTLRALHRAPEPDAAAVRAALERGEGETAWVWRSGLQAQVSAADAVVATWLQALAAASTLDEALAVLPDDFDLADWLHTAVVQGWIGGVDPLAHPDSRWVHPEPGDFRPARPAAEDTRNGPARS